MSSIVWHRMAAFPLETDLGTFLHHLGRQDIHHHVVEERGEQVLYISDASRIDDLIQTCQQWLQEDLILPDQPTIDNSTSIDCDNKPDRYAIAIQWLRIWPLTIALVLLGVLGTLAQQADGIGLAYIKPFLFQSISPSGTLLPLSYVIEQGQYWRLLTPIFIHFGWLHLVFNSVILWDMGRRIELAKGSRHYLVVVLVIGVAANLIQYFSAPNYLFGGLSGIVYGLVGYIGVYQQWVSHPVLRINKALLIAFIVFLLIGLTGVINWFIPGGEVANAAHIGGLLVGALVGCIAAIITRLKT